MLATSSCGGKNKNKEADEIKSPTNPSQTKPPKHSNPEPPSPVIPPPKKTPDPKPPKENTPKEEPPKENTPKEDVPKEEPPKENAPKEDVLVDPVIEKAPPPTTSEDTDFYVDLEGSWSVTTTDMTGKCAFKPVYSIITIKANADKTAKEIEVDVNNTCVAEQSGVYVNKTYIGVILKLLSKELIDLIYVAATMDKTIENIVATIPEPGVINIVITHTDEVTSVLKLTKL